MKHLIMEVLDQIVLVKINRPAALNALNHEVLEELLELLSSVHHKLKIKGLILTGEGEKAFIAGADIKAMQQMDHLQMVKFCELGQKVSLLLEQAPFLTMAAVNGYALGGGLEMALACDFIYASKTAKVGLPEITLGIIPGFGGTQRLARAVGSRLAKEMILSGKIITAEEAKNVGIVNTLCEPASLLEDCIKVAKHISQYSSTAINQAKQAINVGISLGMSDALELEKNMCGICFATKEREEGMKAFIEKRGGG